MKLFPNRQANPYKWRRPDFWTDACYEGPAVNEPAVAIAILELRAELAHTYLSDEGVRLIRSPIFAVQLKVAAVTSEIQKLHSVSSAAPSTNGQASDLSAAHQLAQRGRDIYHRTQLENELTALRSEQGQRNSELELELRRLVDTMTVIATQQKIKIADCLDAVNLFRVERERPRLEPLPPDFVETVVTEACAGLPIPERV
jgi:hypothetical protein